MKSSCLALAFALSCYLLSSVLVAANTESSLSREEFSKVFVTWKRPVIVYNRAVGREQALQLKRRLQHFLDEEIGLYPCGKERSLVVPLPANCTKIRLDFMYWYPGREGHPGDYSVTIGGSRERDAVVCRVGHGQASADRAIDVLVEMLVPYVSQVGGKRRLRPARIVHRVIEGGPSFGEDL